jgi:hypothetical protein
VKCGKTPANKIKDSRCFFLPDFMFLVQAPEPEDQLTLDRRTTKAHHQATGFSATLSTQWRTGKFPI